MLDTSPHFHERGATPRQPYAAGDAFYESLLDAHRGLPDATSRLLNARLVLLLANHIGDLAVLREALAAARAGLAADPPEGASP
jgi:hypothetical protein